MHELGIIIEVVKTVENIAVENGVTKIDTLVLQIGELSTVIPGYIKSCYPAAVNESMLQDTKLKIETIPGNGRCRVCGKIFNLIEKEFQCPSCGDGNYELLSGKEFMIKEIIAC